MNGLEINNLTVEFKNFRLNATLNVPRGCITGLVGRNGAGKSTLIKTIMRQQAANAGSVLYYGKPFRGNEAEILNKLACVFDSPHFNTLFKPSKVFKLYKEMYGGFDAEMYFSLMEKFNLPQDIKIREYSLGMQRKYCLILALSQKPDILLLDEPTSGIDPYDRGNVIELIQQFMLDENHTVLFSTHITEDLDKIADYIAIMQNGEIIISEQKDVLCESYRLVQCPELTEELRACAKGVQKSAFGYSFLTCRKDISGENILVKTPTVEEIFVHILAGRNNNEREQSEIFNLFQSA